MEVSKKKNVCVCKKSYHLTRATSEKNISMFDLSFLHVGSQFFYIKTRILHVFNFLFLQIFFLLSLFLLYYKPSQISNFFFCKHYKSDHVLIKNKKKTAMNQNIMFNNTVCKTCPKLQFWKLKFCSKYKCNCTTELTVATKLFTLNRSCL